MPLVEAEIFIGREQRLLVTLLPEHRVEARESGRKSRFLVDVAVSIRLQNMVLSIGQLLRLLLLRPRAKRLGSLCRGSEAVLRALSRASRHSSHPLLDRAVPHTRTLLRPYRTPVYIDHLMVA
jgi:hypothetical protein